MSQALPGTHLCKEHQGNHSHYAQENCELCRAQAVIERLKTAARAVVDRWHTPLWKDVEATAVFIQRLEKAL